MPLVPAAQCICFCEASRPCLHGYLSVGFVRSKKASVKAGKLGHARALHVTHHTDLLFCMFFVHAKFVTVLL